ncbi:MAG: CBS domain-containing protein [Thaumarchaeota archaeon]|nr:CBS domain-containing protein [Nitrososphaerota archaeon]
MSRNVVTAFHTESVRQCLKTMAKNDIGSVVVTDKTKSIGIFAERDLINRVLAPGKSLENTSLMEVMSSPIVTIEPEDSYHHAAKRILSKKSRLVVLEKGKLVGIVTASDIVKAIHKMGAQLDISRVFSKEVIMIGSEARLERGVREMFEKRIGSVIVSKNGVPDGIFSERDVVNVLAKGLKLTEEVGKLASRPLITAPIDIDGREVARIMTENRIKRIPLIEGGRMAGIVTARDLVEALAMSHIDKIAM